MRILFCCEFYAPSIGGVQEVMRQVAERLVVRGHEVTVATGKLPSRSFDTLNGVSIREFDVSGNLVRGIFGEQERYQDYVSKGDFDVVMIKAAQQWTFDALWPVLDRIGFPKVFIPCGFSGLYEPGYADYFRQMPAILHKFDHLIFYASDYRDIDLARAHGITRFTIIPNGASENEFMVPANPLFRSNNHIPEDAFLFLTVGSLTGLKGHQEIAQAFERMELPAGRNAVLILNGNRLLQIKSGPLSWILKIIGLFKVYGFKSVLKRTIKMLSRKTGLSGGDNDSIERVALRVNQSAAEKKILLLNFPRSELIQAYMAADLFVFASNIEYSPLVLFESAAAGTPFLTVSVGNAAEIAGWTGCGEICPSFLDKQGYTRVDNGVLAEKMAGLMNQPELLESMGVQGKYNWSEQFTWQKIALRYEEVFENLPGQSS